MADDAAGSPVRGFGWRPSLPDARDVLADTSEIPIRADVDPRGDYMTPVYDQGQIGSCTANAVAAAIDASRITDGLDPIYPSRLGIYWLERFLEGQPATADAGAYGRDGFKAARRWGVLPEKYLAYTDDTSSPLYKKDPRKDTDWPPQHWVLQDRYKAVPRSLTAFKRVLSNRQTIAFGFSVPEGFQSAQMARTGIMGLPGDTPLIENAGHEVLAVGYLKAEPHYCLVRNSWGTDWGMDGYFLMPWVWLLETSLSSDFRTIYSPLR